MDAALWTPPPANINALPEPVRKYVHDLETRCDPAFDVQRMAALEQENAALRVRLSVDVLEHAFLEAAIEEETTWREVVTAGASPDGGAAWRARLHAALTRSRDAYDALQAART